MPKNETAALAEATEKKFPLAELLDNAPALFSRKREVVLGALFPVTDGEYTVIEVRLAIEKFIKKEVK